MSDKFFVYQPDGDGCGDFVAFNGAYGESILDEAECVKMLNAFNSTCDSNQALIAKQAEQIKMLRDSLLSQTELWCKVVNTGYLGKWNPEDDEKVIASRAALEASKPVEG